MKYFYKDTPERKNIIAVIFNVIFDINGTENGVIIFSDINDVSDDDKIQLISKSHPEQNRTITGKDFKAYAKEYFPKYREFAEVPKA